MTTRFYLRLFLLGIIFVSFIVAIPISYFGLQERGGEFADGWPVAGILGGVVLSLFLIKRLWIRIALIAGLIAYKEDPCIHCKHGRANHDDTNGGCNFSGIFKSTQCDCKKFIIDPDYHNQFGDPWSKLTCHVCGNLGKDHTDSMIRACLAQYKQNREENLTWMSLFSDDLNTK